jgi:hypothetical protein
MDRFRLRRILFAPCAALCFTLALAQCAQALQGGDFKAEAAQFLASHEPQLRQADIKPSQRLHLLLNLTPAAMYAGDAGKAAAYAQELMALGEKLKTSPGFGPGLYGDATHVGNLVLGRLALLGGDVAQAKEHLLAAGRVPGSPTLISFGPNMLLASELIEKGERDAAVEYLDLCAKFWERQGGKVEGWKAVIRDGGMPNFGASLGRALLAWRFAK